MSHAVERPESGQNRSLPSPKNGLTQEILLVDYVYPWRLVL